MARCVRSALFGLAALAFVTLRGPGIALAEEPAGSHGSGKEHAADSHAAQGHASEGHGASGHGGHGDHIEINWFYGLLGEKPGVEPNLLWRSPGMPIPYLALLINTAVLAYVLVRMAKRPVLEGLRHRRERLLKGMDEAARMKQEAEESLAVYRTKLDRIDTEITRVREETQRANELERRRLLAEAEQRRERLESEARLLIEQELKALQEQLRRETAGAALRSARELLKAQATAEDHRRMADGFLQDLRLRAAGSSPSTGPRNGGRA
jgi:F-type H+-transporting ATPase subunit b